MSGLIQQQEATSKQAQATDLARRGSVRLAERSLSSKLIVSAALMLVLCMVLFSVLAWWLVRAFYERSAQSDANARLASLSQAYTTQGEAHLQSLASEAASAEVTRAIMHQAGA